MYVCRFCAGSPSVCTTWLFVKGICDSSLFLSWVLLRTQTLSGTGLCVSFAFSARDGSWRVIQEVDEPDHHTSVRGWWNNFLELPSPVPMMRWQSRRMRHRNLTSLLRWPSLRAVYTEHVFTDKRARPVRNWWELTSKPQQLVRIELDHCWHRCVPIRIFQNSDIHPSCPVVCQNFSAPRPQTLLRCICTPESTRARVLVASISPETTDLSKS